MTAAPPRRAPLIALTRFAAGDFAFNLYWQSATFYLLYYYTETLRVPIERAANLYMIAALWDGVASVGIGLALDRLAGPRTYRMALLIGALPLGLAFAGAYLPRPGPWMSTDLWLIATQVAFRTAYAAVNMPYLAMSARISINSDDRALVAGMRMIAGTVAAVAVTAGTLPLGHWLGATRDAAAFGRAAIGWAALATVVLMWVGATYHDGPIPPSARPEGLVQGLLGAWRNRAFLLFCGAMVAMVVGNTMVDKSILYYFKYRVGDASGGPLALGSMMAFGGIAVAGWMLVRAWIGTRGLWLLCVALAILALLSFLLLDPVGVLGVGLALVMLQLPLSGLGFALWAMLPDTVEYGQHANGVRLEAALYGYNALLQRVAIAAGTWLLGQALAHRLGAGSSGALRDVLIVFPLGCFILSGLSTLFNPLRRGRHAAIVAALGGAAPRSAP